VLLLHRPHRPHRRTGLELVVYSGIVTSFTWLATKAFVLRQISYRRCVLYGRCGRCNNPGQSRIFLAENQWLSLICEQVDDSAARVKQTLSDRRHGVAPVLLRVTFCRSSYEDGKRQAKQWNKQQLYWKPDRQQNR